MNRDRIQQIRWLLDDYLDELLYIQQKVRLKDKYESLKEKIIETDEVIQHLDNLLQLEQAP